MRFDWCGREEERDKISVSSLADYHLVQHSSLKTTSEPALNNNNNSMSFMWAILNEVNAPERVVNETESFKNNPFLLSDSYTGKKRVQLWS